MGLIEAIEQVVEGQVYKDEQISLPFLMKLEDSFFPAFFTYRSDEFLTWGDADFYTFTDVGRLYAAELSPEQSILCCNFDEKLFTSLGISFPITVKHRPEENDTRYDEQLTVYYTCINRFLTEGTWNEAAARGAFEALVPPEMRPVYAAFGCMYAAAPANGGAK